MRLKKYSMGVTLALASIAAMLVIAGCSDNKSTGSTNNNDTLTAEEQFALLDPYLNNVDPDSPPEAGGASDLFGISPLTFGLGTVHGEFLGGIDLATLGGIEIPGLNKGVPHAINTATVSLNYVDGWWEFEIDSARTDEQGMKTVHYAGKVRFQNASGTSQQVPDETTVHFTEQGDLTTVVNKTDVQNSFNAAWISHSMATIDLNPLTGIATLNVSANGSITGAHTTDLTASTLVLSYDGTTSNVTVSLLEADQCPMTGLISVDFNLKYDSGGETIVDHVDADWKMTANVQASGDAQVTFQSGDFSRTVSENLECGSN